MDRRITCGLVMNDIGSKPTPTKQKKFTIRPKRTRNQQNKYRIFQRQKPHYSYYPFYALVYCYSIIEILFPQRNPKEPKKKTPKQHWDTEYERNLKNIFNKIDACE